MFSNAHIVISSRVLGKLYSSMFVIVLAIDDFHGSKVNVISYIHTTYVQSYVVTAWCSSYQPRIVFQNG